eukprot:CAMPEP_0175828598 /NCGR_PEP_ID=MMETSP0107_2-20121207/12892_1 /TAXON_ID=195067 ORGANISM="Goniomonas pacifica, Strain CCMP1869" /NCGR_SAMPLE_ID=MMETSP0107_2 /ASSEMBLY_ACC=CAM_ASM_000203 /LENGTH=230 /DNA_ID=CAMNT_0017141331 /DNA_START=84 /DNA_END=776 /DNA_ORIENTATION=-
MASSSKTQCTTLLCLALPLSSPPRPRRDNGGRMRRMWSGEGEPLGTLRQGDEVDNEPWRFDGQWEQKRNERKEQVRDVIQQLSASPYQIAEKPPPDPWSANARTRALRTAWGKVPWAADSMQVPPALDPLEIQPREPPKSAPPRRSRGSNPRRLRTADAAMAEARRSMAMARAKLNSESKTSNVGRMAPPSTASAIATPRRPHTVGSETQRPSRSAAGNLSARGRTSAIS